MKPPEEGGDSHPASDAAGADQPGLADIFDSPLLVEKVYRTGDVVPWAASWKPQCGEAKRPLKADRKNRFPRCASGHVNEVWLDR